MKINKFSNLENFKRWIKENTLYTENLDFNAVHDELTQKCCNCGIGNNENVAFEVAIYLTTKKYTITYDFKVKIDKNFNYTFIA